MVYFRQYNDSKNLGFPAHVSQQKGWGWYYEGKDTAKQIKDYSPCAYGLYRTTVGPDTGKQDMFENLTSHAEQLQALSEATAPEIHPTDAPQTTETHQEETQVQEAPTAVTMPPIPSEQESPTESPAADTAPETTPDGQFYRLIILEIVLVVLLLVLLILKARKKKNRQS